MLDGKLLVRFLTQIAKEHHQKIEARKLQKLHEEAVEYYDYWGFNIFPPVKTDEISIINPEWEPPHDKWPRDYDISRKDPDEC